MSILEKFEYCFINYQSFELIDFLSDADMLIWDDNENCKPDFIRLKSYLSNMLINNHDDVKAILNIIIDDGLQDIFYQYAIDILKSL